MGPVDETVDVVVIGFGGAGCVAATTAHDLGADVLVLEKAPVGGGSTKASGGNIRLIASTDRAVEHFSHLAGPGVDEQTVRSFVLGLAALPEWLTRCGGELVAHDEFSNRPLDLARPGSSYPHLPGAGGLGSRIKLRRPPGTTGGEALWQLLEAQARKRRIRVRISTRAIRLLTRDGEVTGVEADRAGTPLRIRARRGVVLACGGFAWDELLLADSLGMSIPSMSPPHLNSGDGVRLAQQVGAQLWHMNAVTARYGFRLAGYEAAFRCTPPAQGALLLDQNGNRYVNETGVDGHSAALVMFDREPASGAFARLPSYLMFDEVTRLAGPIGTQSSGHNRRYRWSTDNSTEIAAGWITAAPNLDALAIRIGVPPGRLAETTARYNRACTVGDDPFGRQRELMAALRTPPFYAVPLWPVLLNTQGGPRRNAASQVLHVDGKPIKGLTSAGELGSMWGPLYPGAVNIAEALITGRSAARSVLQPPSGMTHRQGGTAID